MLTSSASPRVEDDYVPLVCPGMEHEVVLPDGGRVDCVSETHAYEVDWSEKWAEAIGQSLFYSAATGLDPAIILLCRSQPKTCAAHMRRLQVALLRWDLPVLTMMWCAR